jgi:16S rRNA (guanine527-N7)-methyltransferase
VSTGVITETREVLAEGAAALGIALEPEMQRKLEAFVTLLSKWNRTHNLTAIRDPQQMITHHLLDALAVLPHLPQRPRLRVLDVGTGGGVPGIPLAIARPDASFALLDSNRKKASFVTQAKVELDLRNVEILVSRIEEHNPEEGYDVVISRAFSDLSTFVAHARASLGETGVFIAMKGALPNDEIAALPTWIDVVATPALVVPGLSASRHLIVMRAKTVAS